MTLPPGANPWPDGGDDLLVAGRLSAPAHARYVVIWFTRLPADSSGTFQVSVFDVRLDAWA